MVRALAVSLAALALLLPGTAHGYAIEVHKDFYDHAFGMPRDPHLVQPPSPADLDAFRAFVFERAKDNPEFAKRWPTLEAFDAAAFKDLLQLNPGKRVVALDYVPADRATDKRTVVREGSVDPDNDRRNQDRFWLQGDAVQLGPYGRAVPYDPRTTWFGGLTGTPSQFDAHGATLRTGKKGSGIFTAFLHPEQFARPPVPLGSAPEFSEAYTMLAQIAQLWGGEGSEWLALTFGGNNMHGLEDLGNQIHTTVIGTGKFFKDAQWTYFKARVKRFLKQKHDPAAKGFTPPETLSMEQVNQAMDLIRDGHLDQVDPSVRWALSKEPVPLEALASTAIRIIGNHHRLLEDYVQSQYLAAMAQIRAGEEDQVPAPIMAVIRRADAGDKDFEQRCRQALKAAGYGQNQPGDTPFARILAETMIEASAPEAKPLYEEIRAVAHKELRREGTYNEDLGHHPRDFMSTQDFDDAHIKAIWSYTGKAFGRVTSVVRLWDELFRAETEGARPGSPQAVEQAHRVIDRLVGTQLARMQAAEERRAKYLDEVQAKWKDEHRAGGQGITAALDAHEGGH